MIFFIFLVLPNDEIHLGMKMKMLFVKKNAYETCP